MRALPTFLDLANPYRIRAVVALALFLLGSLLFSYRVFDDAGSGAENRPGLNQSPGFFQAQGEAMLKGRLSVPAESLGGECFRRDDRCFGYFGLTPSLLRIPVILLSDKGVTPDRLFLAIALSTSVGASLLVGLSVSNGYARRRRENQTTTTLGFSTFGVMVALSPLLLILTRTSMYEEAIAWYVAFSLLSIHFAVKWIDCRKTYLLLLVLVSCLAGAGSRPTGALLAAALAVLLMYALLKQSDRVSGESTGAQRSQLRHWAVAALVAIGILPLAFVIGTFVVKFRAILPPLQINDAVRLSPIWSGILESNGGSTSSLRFVPTQLLQFLRPDSPRLTLDGSLLVERPVFFGVESSGMYIETIGSFTALSLGPLLVFLTVAVAYGSRWCGLPSLKYLREGLAGLRRGTYSYRVVLIGLPLVCLTPAAVTMPFVGMAVRYLGDFAPLFVVMALGMIFLPRAFRGEVSWRKQAILVTTVLLLAVYSFALSLAIQSAVLAV